MINPYKRYPIYTERTCQMYINKRRNEVTFEAKKGFVGPDNNLIHRCLPISLLLPMVPTSR